MLLHDLVSTSADVGATRSRKAKTERLAELLRDADEREIEVAVGFLTGEPRQGRVGVGWATVSSLDTPPAAAPSVGVLEVDALIDEIRATTGPGSQATRRELLEAVWTRATDAEQQFLARLFIGELRQGALEGVMADAVARAAGVPARLVRRAAMLRGELGPVAALAMAGGAEALEAVGLEVGRAVQPMLASTAEDLTAALDRVGTASVEWKLDGARVQVHRWGDEVRVYTRNLNDVTERSPEVVAATRALDVDSVVLDGEVLAFADTGRPEAFQDTMARFGADDVEASGVILAPYFFDVIHHDGADLLDASLDDRHAVLDRIVPESLRIPRLRTDDPDAARTFFDDAVGIGHEGVMVKGVGGRYEAGRRGKSWLKVKPVHTYDLVVLGAEWGHGRRTGWLSNLHLGARHGDEFVMVGKTFKGLTDELLTWQTDRLRQLVVDDRGHTVFVRPELVVEIALDGVQRSTRYPGGIALRFARVKRYREDKDPTEADELETLLRLMT